MGLKSVIYKQFGKPTGVLGRVVGWIMANNNKERSAWTIEKLKIKPTDYILEVGYGPGSTFKDVADQLSNGFIAGIDHSEVMLQQAAKKVKEHIDRKRAKLECGTVSDLKYPDNYFDIIYGSNVHFFWAKPVEEFKKLYALLKPGGRLIMVFQPRWAKGEEEVKQIAIRTREQYEEAGLKNIELEFKPMRPITCIYISGQK